MTSTQFCILLATIWITPIAGKRYCAVTGALFLVLAVISWGLA